MMERGLGLGIEQKTYDANVAEQVDPEHILPLLDLRIRYSRTITQSSMIQNGGINTLDLEMVEALSKFGLEKGRISNIAFDDEDVSITEFILKCIQRSIIAIAASDEAVSLGQTEKVSSSGISDTCRRAYAASGSLFDAADYRATCD